MLKYILSVPIMLFPYALLSALCCLFTGFLMEDVFKNNAFLLIAALLLFGAVALLSTVILCAVATVKKYESVSMARLNMIIKLFQIPAYITIFVLGLVYAMTIWMLGFTVAFVLVDLAVIALTGLVGAVSVLRAYGEGVLSKSYAVLFAFLQFIYCADVAACIVLFVFCKKHEQSVRAASESK